MIYEEKNTTREINLHKQEFESYIREKLIKNLKRTLTCRSWTESSSSDKQKYGTPVELSIGPSLTLNILLNGKPSMFGCVDIVANEVHSENNSRIIYNLNPGQPQKSLRKPANSQVLKCLFLCQKSIIYLAVLA